MSGNSKKQDRSEKLRAALRNNLRRRKQQTRKVGSDGNDSDIKLRERGIGEKGRTSS